MSDCGKSRSVSQIHGLYLFNKYRNFLFYCMLNLNKWAYINFIFSKNSNLRIRCFVVVYVAFDVVAVVFPDVVYQCLLSQRFSFLSAVGLKNI